MLRMKEVLQLMQSAWENQKVAYLRKNIFNFICANSTI